MLLRLRSSSTPVLTSLLSSISETPNNNTTRSLSLHISPHPTNLSSFTGPGFRRVQSEDNLQGLVLDDDSSNQHFCTLDQQRQKLSTRNRHCSFILETIPSFSFHSSTARYEEEDEESTDMEENMETGQKLMALHDGLGHEVNKTNMVLTEHVRTMTESTSSSGGGGGGGGERRDVEEQYYRRMVEENPGNPLFLRNYAQFLYESKREVERADEYYCRAILADPKDGEILSQYAKLVWEVHEDEGRAVSYHERAVEAAPQDSHVHAAYASFLWETEEDEECEIPALQRAATSA